MVAFADIDADKIGVDLTFPKRAWRPRKELALEKSQTVYTSSDDENDIDAAAAGSTGSGSNEKKEKRKKEDNVDEDCWRIPVIHFSQAPPPFITCVGLNRTEGAFEANLASLNLREGIDYYHFC